MTIYIGQSITGANTQRILDYVSEADFSKYQNLSYESFINKSIIDVDYPTGIFGEQYIPKVVRVMVLKTDTIVSGLHINISGGDYEGFYNTVGAVCRGTEGEWVQGGKHNAYRIDTGANLYCVFDKNLDSWILIETELDHNNLGSPTGGVPTSLHNNGQLPESYGDNTITNSLDSLNTRYFTHADVEVIYHTNTEDNSYFTVNFGNAKPAGLILYK